MTQPPPVADSRVSPHSERLPPWLPWAIGGGSAAFVLAIILAVLFAGVGGESKAIRQVLQSDVEASQQRDANLRSGVPALHVVRGYVRQLRALDFRGCPDDFRLAFQRHTDAWELLGEQLATEPQGMADGFLIGFINGLNGKLDGGLGDMAAGRRERARDVLTTWQEVRRVAGGHGVNIDR